MAVADPEGILVIGTTSQLTDRPRQETFHRFRRNLWNPRVMTFDELLARAKFQVSRMVPPPVDPGSGSPPARAPRGRPVAFAAPAARKPSSDQWDEPKPTAPEDDDDDPDWEPDPDLYRDEPAKE